ncbi:MAG TPA: phosphate ABC transporter substrate-binding protein [Thermoanaerobaculia bacterium]|nr:phosphate ABC transporter substrate-binding protein [Thermoanaerobaculia bacterium]
MSRAGLLVALALSVAAGLFALGCGRGGASRTVIQNKGSDTLVNVAQAWAEAYKRVDPTVAVAVTGGGTGTGIAALINGTVDLANASRRIEPEELEMARRAGADPQEVTVGHDALAIFLHRNNPLDRISLEQLAEIYGEGGKSESWSDLGVEVPGCNSDEIVRVSRQNNSGTYVYFREAVLGERRDYKLGSRDMHGSKDVVDLVAKTPCAIGYSGLAYTIPEIEMPCLLGQDGACVEPSIESALDGSYPISRPLFMYTRTAPEGAVKTYLDWILSDAGQCMLLEAGYAPVRPLSCDQ